MKHKGNWRRNPTKERPRVNISQRIKQLTTCIVEELEPGLGISAAEQKDDEYDDEDDDDQGDADEDLLEEEGLGDGGHHLRQSFAATNTGNKYLIARINRAYVNMGLKFCFM
jgi:hypothetical protein